MKDLNNQLLDAIIFHNIEKAKMLIDKGADVNKDNYYGWTPLTYAASYKRNTMVKLLIDAGADVNKADIEGYTPLHRACEYGGTEIAKLLIDKGADVNKVNQRRETPLHIAVRENNKDMIELLKQHGAKGKCLVYLNEQLIYAVKDNDIELVKKLIDEGADVNKVTKYGSTPLHLVSYDNIEIAKMLIEAGADVNKADNDGWTPLHYKIKDCLILIEAGEDYFNDDRMQEIQEIIELFIKAGADINKADNQGFTPLSLILSSYTEMVRLLKQHETKGQRSKPMEDLNEQLLKAVRTNNRELVEQLIEAGADVNVTDDDGCSPLYWAIYKSYPEMEKLLIKAGADVNKTEYNAQLHLAILLQNY